VRRRRLAYSSRLRRFSFAGDEEARAERMRDASVLRPHGAGAHAGEIPGSDVLAVRAGVQCVVLGGERVDVAFLHHQRVDEARLRRHRGRAVESPSLFFHNGNYLERSREI
jgi:hypothetical protein